MKNQSLRIGIFAGTFVILATSSWAQTLYSTSFEDVAAGVLNTVEIQNTTWKSLGKSEIMTKFHHTGSKCLHLFGGTDNTLEISLAGTLQDCQSIEFQAERWTKRKPFKFRVQAQIGNAWQEVANLDTKIRSGERFPSAVSVKLPEGKVSALRLTCSAPSNAGALIDDFRLLGKDGATPAASATTGAYATSFEQIPAGTLNTTSEGGVTWNSLGKAEVMTTFHYTGSKCLHLFGGTDNTLEISLAGALQDCKGIEFQAERWSSRSPFKFRVQAQIEGTWQEVANLDQLVVVGERFLSHIVTKLPAGSKTALRLVCSAPDKAGVLIDDFKLLKDEPANVTKAPKVATAPIKGLVCNEALFVSGTKETHTFRIPAIITAMNGDLVAVCDARRNSRADLIHVRDIDIAIRRSSDNGATWTPMELVCEFGDGRPASDPSLILDQTTGEIFCFYNYMDQDNAPKEFRLYVQSSKDHGKTWGKARDITDEIAKPGWKMSFKFITSGRGIQTRDGELLHTMVNLKNGLHIFGSKDHGKTWYLKDVPLKPGNESKVIELADGRLMINCRHNGKGSRWVHVSDDRGASWEGRSDRNLVDPGCNGSILRYTSIKDGYEKNRLIFSNASSAKGRKNLAVRISYDEGETWSEGKVIDAGPSAYSDLTICSDGTIGILYEPGYSEVRFTSITLKDLTDGKDSLCKPYQLPGVEK